MAQGRKLIIVRGSEDGNLGVYSNYKLAYEKAITYVSPEAANDYEFKDETLGNHSYAATQRQFAKYGVVSWEKYDEGRVTVELELFHLND